MFEKKKKIKEKEKEKRVYKEGRIFFNFEDLIAFQVHEPNSALFNLPDAAFHYNNC